MVSPGNIWVDCMWKTNFNLNHDIFIYIYISVILGGSYKNWKKRYFVLYETFLSYYAKQGDSTPKGNIDLTMGRGIRLRDQCDLEWPKSAKPGLAFGLAIEERTYYLYGDSQEAVK